MRIEIDTIIFDFKVLKEHDPEEIKAKPQVGSYIYGLFIEASNWSAERHCLEESAPKVLFNKMPMIWLSPVKMGEKDPKRHVSAVKLRTTLAQFTKRASEQAHCRPQATRRTTS